MSRWTQPGERPENVGSYWIQYPSDSHYVEWQDANTCEIFGTSGGLPANRYVCEHGEKQRRLDDGQFDSCRFAPAVPPPDWDLVAALEDEAQYLEKIIDPSGEMEHTAEGVRAAKAIAVRWLSGAPTP